MLGGTHGKKTCDEENCAREGEETGETNARTGKTRDEARSRPGACCCSRIVHQGFGDAGQLLGP